LATSELSRFNVNLWLTRLVNVSLDIVLASGCVDMLACCRTFDECLPVATLDVRNDDNVAAA
jgi:hypothetical protein